MALAFTVPTNGTLFSTTATGPYSTGSITPTANSGILVCTATDNSVESTINTPSWLSGAWTKEVSIKQGTTDVFLTIWSGKVSASPSGAVVTITQGGGGAGSLGCNIIVIQVTGQHATDFVLQPEIKSFVAATSATETLAGALAAADSAVLGVFHHNTNETQTPSGGAAIVTGPVNADGGHNSPTRRLSVQTEINAAGPTTAASWSTSSAGTMAAMEIRAAAGTGHTAGPTDTLALTDAVAKARGLAAADTLALTDARAHARGLGRADTLALADAFARATATARSVPDTVALSDSLATAKVIPLAINDTLSLADNAAPVKLKAVAVDDSVALTDAQAKSRGLAVTDTLALTDSAARAKVIPKAVDDTLTLADARAHARGLARADTLALTDSASTNLFVGGTDHTRQIDDAVALTDARAFSRGLTRTEALSLADNFTRLAAYQRTPTDTLALADLLSRVHTASRTFTDAVTLSDLLSPEVPGEVDIDDVVLLTDELIPMLLREPIMAGHIEYALTGAVPENGTGRIAGGDVARVTEAEGGMVAR